MTKTLAELRVHTYAPRYRLYSDVRAIRERIQVIGQELRALSLYSRRYRELSHERFELNSYADALDSLSNS